MKKIIFAFFAAVVAVSGVANAADSSFTLDLQIGSIGAQVEALQSWLIKNGFTIPAIESGDAKMGKFGAQTRSAVQKFQSKNGIPSTGFVGPLTRVALNKLSSGQTVSTTVAVTCPAGFVCRLADASLASPAPSAPLQTSIMTPGVAGTLAVSLYATPGNGTNVDKAQKADVARYKIQSGASDAMVTSLSLDFNVRLWTYADAITITDENGNAVAGDENLSESDFTELTAGSNYRLTLPAKYVVPKASTKYFIVNVKMRGSSDRSQGNISITKFVVRSMDGTGMFDTQTDQNTRYFTYMGGTTGQLVITVDAYSPPNMRVPISSSGPTDNVVLGVADFTSKGKDGILRKMTLYMSTSNDTAANVGVLALLDDVKVKVGDKVYSADSVGSVVTFSNMNSLLPADVPVPVAIMVKVKTNTNDTLNGLAASSTLIASGSAGGSTNNPLVEDANYSAIDIFDAPLATSDITFTSGDSIMDAPSATLTGPNKASASTNVYSMSMSFTVMAGDKTLYISKVPSTALATTSTGYAASTDARLVDVTAGPDTLAGDTSTYYVIPAGSTRKFTYNGSLLATSPSGIKPFQITGVRYGTTSGALTANTIIYYNYDQLKVSPVF